MNVGWEDGDKQKDQPDPRHASSAMNENADPPGNFRDAAQIDQEQVSWQIGRHQASVKIRVQEVVQPRQDE